MSTSNSQTHGYFWGVLLILIGILFLFDQYGWLDVGDLWPLIIIAVGLWMIIKPRHSHRKEEWDCKGFGDQAYITDVDNIIQSNTFGDVNVTINSRDFKSGEIRTTFGSVKADLTNLNITQGEQILHINTTFGDIKVNKPQHVPYAIFGTNTAGDMKIIEEKRSGWKQSISFKSDDYDAADKKLRIITSQVFGDLKLK